MPLIGKIGEIRWWDIRPLARDSRELFYMEMSDGGRMMAVGVKAIGDSMESTPPLALFDSG